MTQRRGSADSLLATDTGLFSHTSDETVGRIRRYFTAITVPAGTRLTVQGQLGRDFGYIVDGEVVVTIDENEVAQLASTDWYGEIALLGIGPDPRRRTATVEAQIDTVLAVADPREFDAMRREAPEVAAKIDERARALLDS